MLLLISLGMEVMLKTGKSESIKQVNDMLRSGDYREVILDFDISTDEFFKMADHWGDKGAKIKKEGNRFVVKLAK